MARARISSPTTKHEQVRQYILGLAAPNARIPSERELSTEIGVSRDTVRRAIDDLVYDGVLRRLAGVGTFVNSARVDMRLHLSSFSREMLKRGMQPSTRLTLAAREAPNSEVQALFGVDADATLWHIVRVRLADDIPMAHEDAWYSTQQLPEFIHRDLTTSLYRIITGEYGIQLTRADQTIWAEDADAAVREALALRSSVPVLAFRRQTYSGDIPIEYVTSRYRADRYQIHVALDGEQSVDAHAD